MKKLLLTASLLMLCAFSASAQQSKNHKEPRVRFGVGYRYSLGLTEKYKIVSDFGKITSPWGAPEYLRGGELRFEVTVRLTPDWNVGAGTGFGSYDDQGEKTFLGYLKAERLYGKRASRWFNYAEAGATFYPDNGAGLTGSLGGGYRLAMTRPYAARLHGRTGIPEPRGQSQYLRQQHGRIHRHREARSAV